MASSSIEVRLAGPPDQTQELILADGDWFQTIIDDKLYLSASDWDESVYEKWTWQQIKNRADAEEEYRKANQTGSRALYFAQCRSDNETWLPLLEKAYAKAHGDYNSIQGGFTGYVDLQVPHILLC